MPNGKKPTLPEIMADYNAAMNRFGDLERSIEDQIDEIEASPPPLSDAQKAERDRLVGAQKKLRAQMAKIDWATLEKLNDLDNVKKLKAAFDAVNRDLKNALAAVQHIAAVAAATEQTLAAAAQVAAQLAKFLA